MPDGGRTGIDCGGHLDGTAERLAEGGGGSIGTGCHCLRPSRCCTGCPPLIDGGHPGCIDYVSCYIPGICWASWTSISQPPGMLRCGWTLASCTAASRLSASMML